MACVVGIIASWRPPRYMSTTRALTFQPGRVVVLQRRSSRASVLRTRTRKVRTDLALSSNQTGTSGQLDAPKIDSPSQSRCVVALFFAAASPSNVASLYNLDEKKKMLYLFVSIVRKKGGPLRVQPELPSPQDATRHIACAGNTAPTLAGPYCKAHVLSLLCLSSFTPSCLRLLFRPSSLCTSTMMQSGAMLALMATCSSAFVLPQASFNRLPTAASSATRASSSLRMAEEPLGVGVIGCGRIGDVSA